MNADVFYAFSAELKKIAMLGGMWDKTKSLLHESWHGDTSHYPPSVPKWAHGWVGTGPKIRPGAVGPSIGQKILGLGGLTRYLPVGQKALMVAGLAPEVYRAMKRDDPAGLERSRSERLTNVAGNALGGMIGGAAGGRLMPNHPMAGWIAGGMAGSMLGSKLMSAPFSAMRQHRQAGLMQQQQPPQPDPNQQVTNAY